MKNVSLGLALLGLTLGTASALAQGQTAPPPKTRIVTPARDAVVTGPSVHVTLEVQGIEIAPAALHKPGTAHHHLFLDTNVTPADSAIPMGMPGMVHLGKGQTEYTFETVAAGPHRRWRHDDLGPSAVWLALRADSAALGCSEPDR